MSKNAWKYDRKLTAIMIEDFLIDPILAAKVLLGLRIPPHQEIRLLLMWYKSMFLDDSGFSTGKSTTIAIAAALRSCLMEERYSGIISGSFRQAQLIFSNLDKWAYSSSIFRSCIQKHKNQLRISHSTLGWSMTFKDYGQIRAVPPGFLTDSERLKSERWNDGYFDEWNTYPLETLTKTLFGRVTKLNEFPTCPIRQNHKSLFSTPEDEANPSYQLVENIDEEIARGSKDHAHFTCNYRHIPVQKKWTGFVDYKGIIDMQTFNPDSILTSEVDGLWRKSTVTYYPKEIINQCRINDPHRIMKNKRESDSDIIVMGFDTARGGASRNRKGGQGDDFSVSVIVKKKNNPIIRYTYCVRKNGVNSRQCAWVIRRLYNVFHPDIIAYDPGGGGSFVTDELERRVTQDEEGNLIEVTPIVDIENFTVLDSIKVLVPFSRAHIKCVELFGKHRSDSVILNKTHSKFLSLMDSIGIVFPETWEGWKNYLTNINPRTMRDWLNKNKHIDPKERLHAEMDLSVTQIGYIDIERDKNKMPSLDSWGMYKFKSKEKKDSAYSLIYAYYGYLILENRERLKIQRNRNSTSFAIGGY